MALTTNGLTNGGVTAHYQIQYDDSLSTADGRDRANGLIGSCEDDFRLMQRWFGGIALPYQTPVSVQIVPGPAASAGWGPPITLKPGDGSDLTLVRYLLVSEVTEMLMKSQNRGWYGAGNEGSAGEGLSRFLAAQFLIANGLGVTEPGFALANQWMTSPRADYVNNIDVLDHGIDAKTGCAILFIYYLHTQLGHGIEAIIAAAAPELSGVYRNLTQDPNDPFPRFKQLLDHAFPGTSPIPGANPDNPFPLQWPDTASVALQAYQYPDHYVRHANWLAELTTVVNDQDRQDATFLWTDGLKYGNLVSFRAHNFNRFYLRHQDFRLKLQEFADDDLYRADTSFVVVPGLADESALSFQSVNFPDRHLRHKDFHLFLDQISDGQARQDATFRIAPGFVPGVQ